MAPESDLLNTIATPPRDPAATRLPARPPSLSLALSRKPSSAEQRQSVRPSRPRVSSRTLTCSNEQESKHQTCACVRICFMRLRSRAGRPPPVAGRARGCLRAAVKPPRVQVHNEEGEKRVLVTKPLPGTRWLDILTAAGCRVDVCEQPDTILPVDVISHFIGDKCDGVIGQVRGGGAAGARSCTFGM